MKFLYLTLFALATYFIYYGFRSYFLIQLSSELVKKAVPYSLESDNMSVSILILGDSTAVGVGAEKSNDSIAGRLAEKVKATYIENHGVSGAKVDDIFEQLKNVKHQKYDYIILQVGANDMVGLSDLDEVARKYESILSLLPQGDHLIALSCGNLGGAAFFPWPINLMYEKISRNYHGRLQMLVEKYNGDYIQLFVERETDPFVLEPERYLAEDIFHPSSLGYAEWFSKIELVVDKYTEK